MKREANAAWWALAIVIILLLGLGVVLLVSPYISLLTSGGVTGRLSVYCLDVKYAPPSGYQVTNPAADCSAWITRVYTNRQDDIRDCAGQTDDMALFRNCLLSRDIIPDGVIRN